MRKFSLIGIAMLIVSIPTFAGGILTNTNQHVSFLRMLARGASIDIDGVYSNPAGLAFLPEDGLYLSLNGQSAYQTRNIKATFPLFIEDGNTRYCKGKASDEASFNEKNKEYGFELRYYKGHLNKHNVILTQGVDAVCIFVNDTADTEVIRLMADNGVKLLALRCAGYNNVDLKAAADRGITVVRVPAYSPYAVAEYTVALMLSLNRKIPRATWRTRDGNFSLHGLLGFDMYGKTAGIIGTGKIAKKLICILRGFGMNILAYDLYPDYNFAREHQVVYTSLDELYHNSDIISLHCPLTEQTKYLINDYSISKMKDGVMIINTGRGQLIHTNALIEGLKNKKIGSAGLDVYEEESEYFYEDQSDKIIDDDTLARLLSFNNVIVTSHQAFFTREALANIASTTLQNIKDFMNHKPLENEVKA